MNRLKNAIEEAAEILESDLDFEKMKKGTKLILMKGWGYKRGANLQSFVRATNDMPVTFVKFISFAGGGIHVTNDKTKELIASDPRAFKKA